MHHSSSSSSTSDSTQLQQYTKQLEAELKLAQDRYQIIYDSIRTSDKIIYHIKKTARPFYNLIKKLHHRTHSHLKAPQLSGRSLGELQFIYVNDSPKRLNLILNMLTADSLKQPAVAQSVLAAVRQANRQHLALRIITRRALPDAKAFLDFLMAQHVTIPHDYSFYSDSSARLAAPIRRLEIGQHDLFYHHQSGSSSSTSSQKEAHEA